MAPQIADEILCAQSLCGGQRAGSISWARDSCLSGPVVSSSLGREGKQLTGPYSPRVLQGTGRPPPHFALNVNCSLTFHLPAMPILSQFYLKKNFVGDKDCPLGWRWEQSLERVGSDSLTQLRSAPTVQVVVTGHMIFKGPFNRGLPDSLASPDLSPCSCEHCRHAYMNRRKWRSCPYSVS